MKFSKTDELRLIGVHPELVLKLMKIFAAMALMGHPMFVVSGVRSDEEQKRLYQLGRTKPGNVVTNIDGITKRSNHQVNKLTNYGHAVDCAFINDPNTPIDETWDLKQPWSLYGELAETTGLTWGGRWKTLVDLPHIELR